VSKKNLIYSAPRVGVCFFTVSVLDAIPPVVLIHAAWWRASSVASGRKWRRTPAATMAGSNQLPSVVALFLMAPILLEGHLVALFVVLLSVDVRVWRTKLWSDTMIAASFKMILLLPTIFATATMKQNDFIATIIHTTTAPHGAHTRSRAKDVDFRHLRTMNERISNEGGFIPA